MSIAALVTCHGTVQSLDDVPAFLAEIRRGRAAPSELIDEVRRRLTVIGGSPLWSWTLQQAAALEARLGFPVRACGRLWHPFPAEVVGQLAALKVTKIVSIPLAPQSVHVYHKAVADALDQHPSVSLLRVEPYGAEPALIEAFLETIDETLAQSKEPIPNSELAIVLSAHSLPKRVLASGDPYQKEFEAMAKLVAAPLRARGFRTSVAYQSQGQTDDEWLGPDLAQAFRSAKAEGARGVLVAPIGFVSDHVETLYDLDVDAKALAAQLGFETFLRASAVNARPRFVDALEAVTRRALANGAR